MIKKLLPLVFVLTCMNAAATELPTSKEDLLQRFLSAHEAKSYDDISGLINWDGAVSYTHLTLPTSDLV